MKSSFHSVSIATHKSIGVKVVKAMDSKLFTRNVWKPEKGEYVIEVEDKGGMLIDTPYGKRKAILIQVEDEPYIWFINHYGKLVEKSIKTQLEKILSSKKGKAPVKVIVGEVDGQKTYDLEEVESTTQSIVVSVGIYVSDGEDGELHLIHSDNIPIGGDK